MKKTKQNKTNYSFIFSFPCTASLAALNEKSGMIHLKTKKEKRVSTFLHGIFTGVKLKGGHTVDN